MEKSLVHHEHHVTGSEILRDIVIGMSDGLTVPFALAAGLSGAVDNSSLIVLAGLAEIAAGSIAMGLGGYLAGKTEIDHYNNELKREYHEVENMPEKEKEEVREFFEGLGLSEDVQHQAVEELTRDKKRWVDFMMQYELSLEKPDPKRARKSAFNIGVSYVIGGMVPLTPYFFLDDSFKALQISTVITLICLYVFGYFKSRMTGVNPWTGGFKVMMIGAVAASIAFAITKIIEG